MKIVKMKDALGNIQSRIPEKDIPYHLKNGWELVEKEVQDNPVKKKSVKPQVEADILTPNEGEE